MLINNSNNYINRELSWLDFNSRVLEEAIKPTNPPLERMKFLSIYSSNLDEFFMVRVGSLIDQSISNHNFKDNFTGMTAEEQLSEIYRKTKKIDKLLINETPNILANLRANNIIKIELNEIENYENFEDNFERRLRPILTMMVLDRKHPFPYISNKSIFCGVKIKTKNNKEKYGVVLFPKNTEMVYFVSKNKKKINYLLVEEIVEFFIPKIFKDYSVIECGMFKVIRNADLILDDDLLNEEDDYKLAMTEILRKRKMLTPVRLQTNLNKSSDLVANIAKNFNLHKEQVFYGYPYLHSQLAWDLIKAANEVDMKDLMFKKIERVNANGLKKGEPIIYKVLERDYLLIHPYEKFETVISLLREAARDPHVVSIKQTLYRVGNDSAIVRALVEAAENGKDVTVLVELKARFDEQNNLNYASKLEEAGCRVIYGKDNLKVHAKSILITRNDKRNVNYICHIGTGNYNENTAKLYTDVSLLTSNKQIALDLVNFYNALQGGQSEEYIKLLVAPGCMRSKTYDLIDREIFNAKHGLDGMIIAKFNSLADKEMIDKLVEASSHGVKIKLIVRGICCLKAGVKGFSDKIEVTSVIGRFLEHSRIFYFYNNGDDKMYISSADWMSRNLSRRFEISCPIEDAEIKKRLLDSLKTSIKDYGHGRKMDNDGSYKLMEKEEGMIKDSQMFLYGKSIKLSKHDKEDSKTKGLVFKIRHNFSNALYNLAKKISPING